MELTSLLSAAGSLLGPVGAIAGMILPPVVDFAKKKWLPAGTDTPEATLSTLATTNPEVMVDYVDATSRQMEAKIKHFNRDVVGQPSQWVVDTRAAIRPVTTAVCTATVVVDAIAQAFMGHPVNAQVQMAIAPAWIIVGSWFGTRLK